jgi:hypothetical protein
MEYATQGNYEATTSSHVHLKTFTLKIGDHRFFRNVGTLNRCTVNKPK